MCKFDKLDKLICLKIDFSKMVTGGTWLHTHFANRELTIDDFYGSHVGHQK